jgi:hypothetical protein
MKSLLFACALSAIAFSRGTIARAESAIPAPYGAERYQQTFTNSPFALATPKEEKVEEVKDSPLNNLVVTGMGKLDDGRDFVIVQRIGDEGSMRFEGNAANREGLSVKQVKWGDSWSKSSVTMAHGSEQKEIKFKENAAIAAAVPSPQPGQRGAAPGVGAPPPIVPTGLNNAARPAGIPKAPGTASTIPRPTTGYQVPRPGGGVQLPTGGTNFRSGQPMNPGANQPVPTNGASRTRVRSINNR